MSTGDRYPNSGAWPTWTDSVTGGEWNGQEYVYVYPNHNPVWETPAVVMPGVTVTIAQDAQKEKRTMRSLYEVYVVNPETDEVLVAARLTIAKSEESAVYKALHEIQYDGEIDDLDTRAVDIMQVRDKPKVQQVEVVER